jgi:antirestriction protein ArdC
MKRNIYEQVTNRVLELLSTGVAPWRRQWKVAGILPTNLKSGKVYRGINVLVLAMSGFASPYWLTFHQALERGGKIRAGEKGTQVVFWKFLRLCSFDKAGSISSCRDSNKNPITTRIPLLRHYTVFNLEQIDGIDAPKSETDEPAFNPIESGEKVIAEMPNRPAIRHGSVQAFYDSRGDIVSMPPRSAFTSSSAYYSTLLHEIGHATGSVKRLARPAIVSGSHFGDGDYSQEELVAEFASAFLCAQIGIENEIEQSASYLQGWLSALRNDKKMLVQAAGLAQRAADYVLNVRFDEEMEPVRNTPSDELAIAA